MYIFAATPRSSVSEKVCTTPSGSIIFILLSQYEPAYGRSQRHVPIAEHLLRLLLQSVTHESLVSFERTTLTSETTSVFGTLDVTLDQN